MDTRIRNNEICSIGLPRCDYVFSSTRSCFIAYGFEESRLEVNLLTTILQNRGIQAVQAEGFLTPGQNAYCTKICSKIIVAQFCVVIINNDMRGGIEVPNANVNMEYGLMLGFNKYVIPFQRESQGLPFNLAGLDTIKYGTKDFLQKAENAIETAILATQQRLPQTNIANQLLDTYFLSRNMLVSHTDSEGEKNLFRLGAAAGFNMLNDFSGTEYIYFGNFAAIRGDIALWRIRKLIEILSCRRDGMRRKMSLGLLEEEHVVVGEQLFDLMKILILLTSEDDVNQVKSALTCIECGWPIEFITVVEVNEIVEGLKL